MSTAGRHLSSGFYGLTPLREIYLQRPARPGAAVVLRAVLRNTLIAACYLLCLLALGAGTTWLQLALFSQASLPVTEAITFLIAIATFWYSEFYRAGRKRRQVFAAARQAASQPLHDLHFADGSSSDFTPAGTVLTSNRLIVAIDPKRALLRVMVFASNPAQRTDWLCALPDNMDLDVGLHPPLRQPARPVPSLIFSEEQEDGFKVIAWPLATESIAEATRLTAELRASRESVPAHPR